MSQTTSSLLRASGGGTARVSPVARSSRCMPLVSLNAKYLPSGEIAPLFTGLSEELMVSCRSFRSGRGGYVGERCLAYHRNADPISKIEAAHKAHGDRLDRLDFG